MLYYMLLTEWQLHVQCIRCRGCMGEHEILCIATWSKGFDKSGANLGTLLKIYLVSIMLENFTSVDVLKVSCSQTLIHISMVVSIKCSLEVKLANVRYDFAPFLYF